MPDQRQHSRQQIVKLIDEMIADLTSIKHTALHMDTQTIRTMEAIHKKRFQLLHTIYTQLATSQPTAPKIPLF